MLPGIRDKSGLAAASCLAAFGGYVIYAGLKLSYVADVGPGPGFFPFWIGFGLLLFSFYQSILCLSAPRRQGASATLSWRGSGRAVTGWIGMAISIYLYRWIGFAVSFVILTGFIIVVIERRPVLPAIGVGVALAVVFHLLFVVALGVSLPTGPWGF
jgi:hypothetical protein